MKICPECNKNECADKRNVCNTCRNRKWIENNRVRKCWHNIKRSAKKRKILFDLPFNEFEKIVLNTGYMKNKGRLSNDLTIDRDRPELGYTVGNLIVMPKRVNVQKYHSEEKENNLDYPF